MEVEKWFLWWEKKVHIKRNSKDVYQKYEIDVLNDLTVDNANVKDIIDLRVKRKIDEDLNDYLNIEFLKKKEQKYLMKRLNKERNGWNEFRSI